MRKKLSMMSPLVLLLVTSSYGGTRSVTAAGANAVTPGEFVIDPPTLINLGFEWFIDGDDNRNAGVAVSYRKKGESQWKQALPLLRLQGERVYSESRIDVVSPNMFAGSILDLEPDTAYEAQFVVSDPDGVSGEARKMVEVRTRPEPKPYGGGRAFHVYPPGFKGTKIEPSFEGLMCAYNYWCAGTDWATAGRPRVRPGDTILVHAGLYNTTASSTPTTRPSIVRRRWTAPTIGTGDLSRSTSTTIASSAESVGD